MNHDPNGESYAAFIERMAGACPPREAKWPDVPLTKEQADRLDAIEHVETSDWPLRRPVWPPEDEGLSEPPPEKTP